MSPVTRKKLAETRIALARRLQSAAKIIWRGRGLERGFFVFDTFRCSSIDRDMRFGSSKVTHPFSSCLDLIFGIIGIPRNDSRSSQRERITAASKRCIFEIPRLFTARGKGREKERKGGGWKRSEGRFERAIINIFPRVKLTGRRLLSEFVPGVRDKRRNARRRRRIQSRDLGMLYIPPFSVRISLDFSARIRINPGRVEYDPDFIHAGAFVHIRVINLSLVKWINVTPPISSPSSLTLSCIARLPLGSPDR